MSDKRECICGEINARNCPVHQGDSLREIVNHQSNMESLWLLHPTVTEALLMSALRHLHAVIEGDEYLAEIQKQYYWNVEDEL